MAQCSTCQNAGVLALIHHDTAVNQNVIDAHGELLGLVARGRRLHRLGIEHHDHRIRYAMTQEPMTGLLQGTVEVDETYVGG